MIIIAILIGLIITVVGLFTLLIYFGPGPKQ